MSHSQISQKLELLGELKFHLSSHSGLKKSGTFQNQKTLANSFFKVKWGIVKAWANVSNYSSNKSSNCLMENFENLMESNFPFVLTIKLVWSKHSNHLWSIHLKKFKMATGDVMLVVLVNLTQMQKTLIKLKNLVWWDDLVWWKICSLSNFINLIFLFFYLRVWWSTHQTR